MDRTENMKVPEFAPFRYLSLGWELQCPICGEVYLHQERTEVFERAEDSTYGVHAIIVEGKAVINTSLEENPSPRRQGLKITFFCENCGGNPVMTILQHKGTTYANFKSGPTRMEASKGEGR